MIVELKMFVSDEVQCSNRLVCFKSNTISLSLQIKQKWFESELWKETSLRLIQDDFVIMSVLNSVSKRVFDKELHITRIALFKNRRLNEQAIRQVNARVFVLYFTMSITAKQ